MMLSQTCTVDVWAPPTGCVAPVGVAALEHLVWDGEPAGSRSRSPSMIMLPVLNSKLPMT